MRNVWVNEMCRLRSRMPRAGLLRNELGWSRREKQRGLELGVSCARPEVRGSWPAEGGEGEGRGWGQGGRGCLRQITRRCRTSRVEVK